MLGPQAILQTRLPRRCHLVEPVERTAGRTGSGPGAALLHAADEKNRQGSRIPLRENLAADLRVWLADKLTAAQEVAKQRGEAKPVRLASDTPLFTVPAGLVRILDRDLQLAGIRKRDERGWAVAVHALRHTPEQRQRRSANRSGRHASFVD